MIVKAVVFFEIFTFRFTKLLIEFIAITICRINCLGQCNIVFPEERTFLCTYIISHQKFFEFDNAFKGF